MAEATIDELRIEVEAESEQAANGLEKLIQKLDRLKAATAGVTENNGLAKIKSQLNKLVKTAQQLQNLSGFDKITQLVNALRSLNGLGSINTERVDTVVASMRRLRNVVEQVNAMPNIDTAKFRQLADALQPFAGANTQGFAEFLKSLQKLPKIAEKLDAMDFGRFADQMQQLAQAVGPVVTEFERMARAFEHMPDFVRQFIVNINAASNAADNASNSNRNLNKTLGNIKVKTAAAIAALSKLIDKLGDCVNTSNQFVENLNLFKVTMGDSADEAYKFAEAVNDAMGIDTSDWVRYQGFFQSIGKGFGIASDKADLMSQNLTQLSYDLSSFYNTSVDEAYNKVVSGISGELEPLKRYGFALDEATLKQLAYEKGITQSIESMTQAQKAQLRYVAILEQAGNIGVLGDMSRTIDTSANQLRILTARLQQFARAVGDMVMPVLSAMLPVMTAFIQLLTEGAQAIAEFLGFELPRIDLNTSDVTQGYNNITDATNAATEATEKFKGSLAGVDQLNIIGSKTESGTGSGTGLNYDLDIDLPSYDFLNGVESKTKEIFEGIKKWAKEAIPWIEAVAAAIGGIFIGKTIFDAASGWSGLVESFKKMGEMLGTENADKIMKFATGIGGGLAAGAASGVLLHNSLKKIITSTGNIVNNIFQLVGGLGIAAGAIALFIKFGNPIGAIITGVVAGLGLINGVIGGINENIMKQNEEMVNSMIFGNGGTKVTEIADAYTDWANAAENVNRNTIDKLAQLGEYDGKMDSIIKNMDELLGADYNLNNITPADAASLKQPFEELITYLQDDFSTSCKTLSNDLVEIFSGLGIGAELTAEFQQAYDNMEAIINGSLSEANDTVQKYLDMSAQGQKLTPEQMAEFQHSYDYARDMAQWDDASFVEMQSAKAALDQIDFSTVDLENDENALNAIQRIQDAYASYTDSVNEKYRQEVAAVDRMQGKLDVAYSFGEITQQEYEAQSATLFETKNFAAAYARQQLFNANTELSDIITGITSEIGEAAKNVDPNVWQGIVGLGFNAQVIAESDFLKSNEIYQKALEAEKNIFENNPLDIPIDTDSMAAQIMGVTSKLNPIKLPVGIEIVFGENNDWAAPMLAAIKEYAEGNPASVASSAPSSVYTATRGDVLGSTTGIVEGQQGANSAAATEFEVVAPMPVYVEVDGETVGEALANLAVRATAMTNGK